MPSGRGHREFRSRPPPRDYPPRRFQRDEYQRPVSARNKESNSNKDQDSKDEKFRNRVPALIGYFLLRFQSPSPFLTCLNCWINYWIVLVSNITKCLLEIKKFKARIDK